MRKLDLPDNYFDIILAAATLHHLRDDNDWELMFTKIYKALKPGGSFWISDLITHNAAPITKLFEDSYSRYLRRSEDLSTVKKFWIMSIMKIRPAH